MSDIPQEELEKAMRRLGKSRLAEECESLLGDPPDGGLSWRDYSVTALTDALATRAEPEAVERLAADGKAKPRSPGTKGVSWRIGAGLSKDRSSTIEQLTTMDADAFGPEINDPEIFYLPEDENITSQLFDLHYHTLDYAFSGESLQPYQEPRSASIAIDHNDSVLTVFSPSSRMASAIASGAASELGFGLTPVRLTDVRSPKLKTKVSESSKRLLEVVYGRWQETHTIINAEKVWTRPSPLDAALDERTGSGEGKDVLSAPDVRRELKRGDDLVGLRILLRSYEAPGSSKKGMLVQVTLKEDKEIGLSLSVRGGSYRRTRVMGLYEDLRSRIMRPSASDGASLFKVLQEIEA